MTYMSGQNHIARAERLVSSADDLRERLHDGTVAAVERQQFREEALLDAELAIAHLELADKLGRRRDAYLEAHPVQLA